MCRLAVIVCLTILVPAVAQDFTGEQKTQFDLLSKEEQKKVLAIKQKLADTGADSLKGEEVKTFWKHFNLLKNDKVLGQIYQVARSFGSEQFIANMGFKDKLDDTRVTFARIGMLQARAAVVMSGKWKEAGGFDKLKENEKDFIRAYKELFRIQ